MNITMIGMPGCGKSTVGVLLAKAMELDFVDCDLVIQSKHGASLQKIINERGIKGFLEVEEAVLCEIDAKNSVIATGGSAVYSERAMQHLQTDALTLYIRLPYAEIERRLTNIQTRGVAMEKGTTLEDIYNERIPLYERYADVTVDADGLDIEETVLRAKNAINSYLIQKMKKVY